MNMYSSVKSSSRDLQVVPDDGYNSPVHSPYYYTTDSVKSPASSDTSAVDSAFDDLIEVIPELSDSENFSEESCENYSDMATFGIYGSSFSCDKSPQIQEEYLQSTTSMYEAVSPHSESKYVEPLSPSGVLIQATVRASAKRPHPQYHTSTINFNDLGQEEPPKKRQQLGPVMTQSEALDAYTSLLAISNQSGDNKLFFFAPPNDDSGIDVKPPVYETLPKTQSRLSGSLTNQTYILDDDILTSKFSVLADYLNAAPTQECQQTRPKNMPSNPMNIKEEPEEETLTESRGSIGSSEFSNDIVTRWVTNAIQSQVSQAPSCGQTNQTAPLSEPLPKTTSFSQQQVNCQLSVTEMCKKISQNPSSVVFFNIPKEKKETEKPSIKQQVNVKITVPIDPQKMVQNWKGPIKTKRPNLVSHSSKPRLYNFLLELLNDRNSRCIEWLDKELGTFKFIHSAEVAHLWGLRKNKPNMKYENFARSLRTYISKGILMKPRNKLVYQFTQSFL